eukprot:evm.model.scf_281.4 EVM.evm.TU.scf_281.4   scf_281:37255-51104(+)
MGTDFVQQLPQLEALCERLYNSQVPEERAQAEQHLRMFGASTEGINACKAILDNSQSAYAQLLASSSLLKIVTEHSVSPAIRLEMRNYFLSFLDSRGPQLEAWVVTSVVQLLCRTTKVGWFDDQQRTIVEDARRFLQKGSMDHYLLGLKILNMLVCEMNNQPKRQSKLMTVHRKTAVAFRDNELGQVFQLSLFSLRQLQEVKDDASTKLKDQALQLALNCLTFDFVGTCLDDCEDVPGTIQVPSSWRPVIEDPATVQVFYEYYGASSPPLSNTALECLVRLASVRRSLFQMEVERSKLLNRLMTCTRDILRTQQGLSEQDNYHEFCKLLGRIKANFNLQDLVNVENYAEWIELVANFTMQSLNSWQWAASSMYYLLALWSRLVTSMPYLKGDSPSLMEANVPKIVHAYLTSRLDCVRAVLQNGITEDPLDNEGELQDQLESLPHLFRFQYDKTCVLVCSLLDPIAKGFQDWSTGQPPGQDARQLSVLEGQLTWLVYIIGAVLRGRLSTSSSETMESLDGDLSARVFSLLGVMETGLHQQRYRETSRQRLDLAILSFFQSFRRVYIGETVMHSSKVYARLGERLPGIRDHLTVLNIIVKTITNNLRAYGDCDGLIDASLSLFQDLGGGYMSGKLLMKLETVNTLLQHHSSDRFDFLRQPTSFRSRTIFYNTLTKLLFMEDTPTKFKTFVAPMQQVLVGLHTASQSATSAQAVRQSVPKETVMGLFRDLRGVVSAAGNRRSYGLIFDWLYPAHFPVILTCLEAWSDSPEVTTPLLKFMAEFVQNKTQRLSFDLSSPNGILLFREVSKVLVMHGSAVLQRGNVPDIYQHKYKGIWICLQILTRALAGNYVNFGVFGLYGDPALEDALKISLKMALSIPLNDIIAYKKLARAFYSLVDVLCEHHTSVIAACQQSTFAFIMTSLETGLKALDVTISSQCAAALNHLAAYYFRHVVAAVDVNSPPPAAQALAEHIRQTPDVFPSMLKTLFEIVLFEECTNMWSLSRPMLSLILINEEVFTQLKSQFVSMQPTEKQQHTSAWLEKLMQDVQRNLDPKNRDKFTQNLTIVRHEFKAKG